MEEFIPDFILQADNVYRTRNYIVKQRLEYIENTAEDNVIISYDTFYKRTRLRDKQYMIMYGDKITKTASVCRAQLTRECISTKRKARVKPCLFFILIQQCYIVVSMGFYSVILAFHYCLNWARKMSFLLTLVFWFL